MAEWVRGFIVTDVMDVHEIFQKCIRDAEVLVAEERRLGRSIGGKKLMDELVTSYDGFNVGLRQAAEKAAVRAIKGMRERLEGTRERVPTGTVPALQDLLEARPLDLGQRETGAVGVGNVQLLNRAINPHSRGYGTYWRAQEYGTGQGEVRSQIGRILYGSFQTAGGSEMTAPMAEYAGGGGPHPVFKSGYSPSVDGQRMSGLGTIGKEIRAKHFIKFGADEAAVMWRVDVAEVQTRALDRLDSITLPKS